MSEGRFYHMSYDERWELLKYMAQNSEMSEMRSNFIVELKEDMRVLNELIMPVSTSNLKEDPRTGLENVVSESHTYSMGNLDLIDEDDDDYEVNVSLDNPPLVIKVVSNDIDNLEVHSLIEKPIVEKIPITCEIIEDSFNGIEKSETLKNSWEVEVDALEAALNGYIELSGEEFEENLIYSKKERVADNFENPFFDELLDREDENTYVETFEVKENIFSNLFEKCLVEEPLGEFDLSTPCIWDDYTSSLDTYLFNPSNNHCLGLTEYIAKEKYYVDAINEVNDVKDFIRCASLSFSSPTSLSFMALSFIASYPLLYPLSCLSRLSYNHFLSEMIDVLPSPLLPLHFDTSHGRPPDQYKWHIDEEYLSVVEYWGVNLSYITSDLSFEAPFEADEWSYFIAHRGNCHVKFDKLKRYLSMIFCAYILPCCYLCFHVAHAQVYDLLLRALCCYDVC